MDVVTRELEAVDWSYLAGLFAGDGCFLIGVDRPTAVPRFSLEIQMTDKGTVEDVAERWGGSVTAGSVHGSRLRQPWSWRVHDGYAIRDIVEGMRPWLVGDKRNQAEAYLRFVHAKLGFYERRTLASRRGYTLEELLKLWVLAREARRYAIGAVRSWRETWDRRIEAMEAAVGAERAAYIRQCSWEQV